jgi:hypothetical protein
MSFLLFLLFFLPCRPQQGVYARMIQKLAQSIEDCSEHKIILQKIINIFSHPVFSTFFSFKVFIRLILKGSDRNYFPGPGDHRKNNWVVK